MNINVIGSPNKRPLSYLMFMKLLHKIDKIVHKSAIIRFIIKYEAV